MMITDGPIQNLLEPITQKDKQERLAAAATSTSEVLAKLSVNIDAFPQKCQQLLLQTAKAQTATDIEQVDTVAISLHQSKLISEQLSDDYEILKLKQKEEKLQAKIDRNNRFLDELRKELECSKSSLMLRSPNPETVQEAIRQMKQKVASYEESCEKAKRKYSKLPAPERESVVPPALGALAATLERRRADAARLQAHADDVSLAARARFTLTQLMR